MAKIADYQSKLRPVLYNPKYSKEEVLAYIKNNLNPSDFGSAISSHPLLYKQKLKNLKFGAAHEIEQRQPFQFSGDLKREVMWILFNIIENAEFVNQFVGLKNDFEAAFLLSKYQDAISLLDLIKSRFGESLWSIEMELLLSEFCNGTQSNWEKLSDLLQKVESPFYQFLMSFYSKRIEENMSLENCVVQFQNDLNGVQSEPMVQDFFVCRSIPFAKYDYDGLHYEGVLYISNLFGVIDQFLIFSEVLAKLLSVDVIYDKMILQIAKKLYKLISADSLYVSLINILDADNPLIEFSNSRTFFNVANAYSVGDFEKSLIESKNNIQQFPSFFEYYELYCKSLINLGRKFEPTELGNIINDTLRNIYDSLQFNGSSQEANSKLMKLSLTFSSFNFGKQLAGFFPLLGNDNSSNRQLVTGLMHSFINNPKLIAAEMLGREVLMNKKFETFYDMPSVHVNRHISAYVDTLNIDLPGDYFQRDLYTARYLFRKREYSKVISILEKFRKAQLAPFYFDNVVYMLFEAYRLTDDIVQAIDIYAQIFIRNEFMVRKLDVQILVDTIKKNGIHKYSHLIDLPILFSGIYKDYNLYEGYIEFMGFIGEDLPSKIDSGNLIDLFGVGKVVFFYKEICSVSTMRYSLDFESIDQVESERYDICQLLKGLDKDNLVEYEKEMAEILRSAAVRKVIKEVNEGRLYVNVESLKKMQINNTLESYNRYKEIENISREKGLVGFNSTKDRNWLSIDFRHRDANPSLNEPAFLAFKSIYLETRDRFLFSKEYGLDSCLSTNFRHGAVKNHIRSVFENLSLVTSRLHDQYVDNSYWLDKIEPYQVSPRYLIERLNEFSKCIDDLTSQVISELIQIQTERSSERTGALFAYLTNDKTLYDFFEEHRESFTSVESVIDILYTDLSNYTVHKVCLDIHRAFTGDINNKYQSLISALLNDIRANTYGYSNDLVSSILQSSTRIQKELEVISDWFTFNTTSSLSILDIETIINASKEYVNAINPNSRIEPNIHVEFPVQAYTNLIFVFNILFTNIIEHSKLASDEVVVNVEVFNPKENYIQVRVGNSVSSDVDLVPVREKLSAVQETWNNHENIDRSNIEGGSGFDKIKRILLYEANAKTDRFDFEIQGHFVSINLYLPFRSVMIGLEKVLESSILYEYEDLGTGQVIPNIDDSLSDVLISNYSFFAFNIIIRFLMDHRSDHTTPRSLSVVAVPREDNFCQVTFTTISTNSNVFKYLNGVKANWSNVLGRDTYSKSSDPFEHLKGILKYQALVPARFDFSVGEYEVSISLFFPMNL